MKGIQSPPVTGAWVSRVRGCFPALPGALLAPAELCGRQQGGGEEREKAKHWLLSPSGGVSMQSTPSLAVNAFDFG